MIPFCLLCFCSICHHSTPSITTWCLPRCLGISPWPALEVQKNLTSVFLLNLPFDYGQFLVRSTLTPCPKNGAERAPKVDEMREVRGSQQGRDEPTNRMGSLAHLATLTSPSHDTKASPLVWGAYDPWLFHFLVQPRGVYGRLTLNWLMPISQLVMVKLTKG